MAITEQQLRAINESGKNIIVSAGAGSGKTKVLSERVFDRISNKKYKWNIDEMLVLTFTNAAAINMKLRIRNKILQNENNILSEEEQQNQLNKIDSSFIMTFDAYAQFLVKKYHQIINVDKNIKIIDKNIIKNKTYEILNNILEEEYKNANEKYINLINTFCVKDDNDLRERIININDKLNSIYNRCQFIKEYKNKFYSTESIQKDIDNYSDLVLSKVKQINELLNEFSSYVENYNEYFVGIDNLLNSSSYNEIKLNCNIDHSKKLMKQGEEAKQIKANITALLKEINNLCVFDEDQLKQQILDTKDNTLYLIKLAEELNNRLKEYKKEINMYEFSDIFEMAINLVNNNEEIRKEIEESFKEILIDEYQDTNDIQDEFIKTISKNNIYMVGDIKQSIYRFRNANPYIFMDKYQLYKEDENGCAINLTANFRSRKEVIEGIDSIFSRIMNYKIGGADYVADHKMSAGNADYENNGHIDNQSHEMEILNYPFNSDELKKFPFNTLSKTEVEAFIIAKDIEEKVKSKYKVTYIDEKTGKMKTRPVEYKDFTILADRGTSFEIFKQILTYKNIPSDIQTDEKMDESDLITVIRAIFKLICCIKDEDYGYDFVFAYMSLARSFLVEMLDSTLYEEITTESYKNSSLYNRVTKLTKNIEIKSISDILDEFIEDFDVYNKLSKIGDIHENFVKIDYLYQLAESLNESGYNYSSFNDYLIDTFDSDNEDTIKFKIKKDNQNAVTITNIHQSKGLEYSICYYPLLTVGFNKQDLNDSFAFNKNQGLIIPTMIKNKGLKQTIRKELFKQQYNIDDISERIRLFYVALTRAKEKIILVCPLENKTQYGYIVSDENRLSINCYKDLLDMVYDDISKYIKDINLEEYKDIFTKDYKLLTKDIFKEIPKTSRKVEEKEKMNIIPSTIDEESFSKKAGLINKETIEKMELGSRVHYYLEALDFNEPNYDLVDDKYVELIKSFLNSEIMKDLSKARIYKEYEFIYKTNNIKEHGFIDLLMEYDDHFDIIDYKTKNIDDENYDKQLNGYRKYIKSISDKKVNCYLYSIVDKTYREVK